MTALCSPTVALAVRPASGNGQAIKDAVSGVLAKTDTLVTTLDNLCDLNCQSTDAGKMFKSKVNQMKGAQMRAKGAHDRLSAEAYQKVNRKNSKRKSVDGCNPDVEVCVATPTGPLSVSSPVTDPEIDEETGKDMVEDLNEVSADVDQLNAVLSGNVPPAKPTVYAELSSADYFFNETAWPSAKVAFAAFLANLAAEKVAEMAKPACEETIVALGAGGNGSLACLATEGIYMVLKAANDMMNYIGQDRSSAEITGAYARIGNVYEQLLGTGGDLNTVKRTVEAMGKELLIIENNQKYIIQLLTTPQGQRPGFPTGGGTSSSSTTPPKTKPH